MKKILITGAGSYIGTSFENYINTNFPDKYTVDTVDMIGGGWKEKDFSPYDTVFHVAGIAHSDNGKIAPEKEKLYYSVNAELTSAAAEKAKSDGARQFIFMSSAIVYGNSAPIGKTKIITADTPVSPANCYGDSKVQAEKRLKSLEDENFKVVILRPPMIYGKGSKGNYPLLAKLALNLPFFPRVQNERSMLYIENLCEFVRLMVENEESGTFFPQNSEYSNTSELVEMIAAAHGKKIKLLGGFTWALKILSRFTTLVNKAFGNLTYEKSISDYKENYRIASSKESIKKTEKVNRVLFLVNHDVVIYNFRLELVEKLLKEGNEVYISSPYGEKIDRLIKIGCKFCDIKLSRHGTNPINELKVVFHYISLLKKVKPSVVLTYTIKPNIYGGIACSLKKIPYVTNISGLGSAIENGGFLQRLTLKLYKIGLKKAEKVFFQNSENQRFMLEKGIVGNSNELLPGSGVNLERNSFEPYPDNDNCVTLLTIGRIMKDKGTDEILEAAKIIKKKYPFVIFRFIGFYDDDYNEKISAAVSDKTIEYWEQQPDVHPIIKNSHATLHASYHEGMSNVLLETAACGRPIIATDVPGCRETYDDGVSGISFKPRDVKGMVDAIEKFLSLSNGEKAQMGAAGRKKMEKEFNRDIIVDKYLSTIKKFIKEDEENELVQQNS